MASSRHPSPRPSCLSLRYCAAVQHRSCSFPCFTLLPHGCLPHRLLAPSWLLARCVFSSNYARSILQSRCLRAGDSAAVATQPESPCLSPCCVVATLGRDHVLRARGFASTCRLPRRTRRTARAIDIRAHVLLSVDVLPLASFAPWRVTCGDLPVAGTRYGRGVALPPPPPPLGTALAGRSGPRAALALSPGANQPGRAGPGREATEGLERWPTEEEKDRGDARRLVPGRSGPTRPTRGRISQRTRVRHGAFRLGRARPGRADTDVKAGLEKRGEEMSVLCLSERHCDDAPAAAAGWLQRLCRRHRRRGRRRAREVGGWVGARRPCCSRWRRKGASALSKRDAKRSGAAAASASTAGSPVQPVVVERVPPREDDVPRHVQRRRLGRLRQRPQPGARERRRLCGDGDCCRRRRRLTGGRHVVLQEIGRI